MPKNNEVNFGEFFRLPNPGLKSYFDRVRSGNDEEYRTTFYKGKTPQQILAMWMPALDSGLKDWPTLLEFEKDLAKKVGPLSIQKPLNERMDDIDSYYDSIHLESKPISDSATAAVVKEWGSYRGLHIRSAEKTVDKMKLSTNSGSPEFTKRKLVIGKTIPFDLVEKDLDIVFISPDGNRWYLCAILGWRGQEGGPTWEDVKQRVVWMFPLVLNIAELQFYQVGIEAGKLAHFCPAWESMDAVDERITRLFDTKGRGNLVVVTDFKGFDQHFNSDLQNCAKRIESKLLDPSEESRWWLETVFPAKYKIPLAYDYGFVRRGKHGMGSGSGGTNFDETLAHRALQYEAAQESGSKLNPNSQCLGDDGVLSYPGITVEDVMRTYSQHGQVMNPDKQYASKVDCVYLRRWHHTKYRVDGICVGVYATCRAIGRLCEQERYYSPEIWGPKMVALRQLSIIENCKYHPLFEQFVRFCMKGDKYRLGIDIPGFLDNIEHYAKEAIDVMPDFLGYTKSMQSDAAEGISQWRVVQYLKSIAKSR